MGREKSACKEMIREGGKPSERVKSIWTLLSFLFFFEGAVGRAEWLSEHRMNAGIHTGSGAFQHPFKPRVLLERAPKALCRGPWEGSSCLQYLCRHRERGSFVPGCGGQDESLAEKKGAFCLLQQRFAGSRHVSARGSWSPRNPVVPHQLLCHGVVYLMSLGSGTVYLMSLGSDISLQSQDGGVSLHRTPKIEPVWQIGGMEGNQV